MSGVLLYGGTFNPVHLGHISICRKACEALSPERVLLMPAASPPHKEAPELAPSGERLEMCRLAAKGLPSVTVDDYEIKKGGRSYTIETLEHLAGEHPGEKLWLLVGTDMFLTFEQWVRWQDIGKLATIVAASRRSGDDAEMEKKQGELASCGVNSVLLDNAVMEMSSTAIRKQLRETGLSEKLSPFVLGHIRRQRLYGATPELPSKEVLRAHVASMVTEKRFRHILGVESSAVELAERYGADAEKASTAAIFHDCCKYLDAFTSLQLIADSGIISGIDFAGSPQLMHSHAGARYAELIGVTDSDIVNAIRYHTTGRAGMSRLEMVVYIADLISEERSYPDVDQMRRAARVSLESGMATALSFIMKDLPRRGLPVCRDTREAYNYYCVDTRK